MTVKLGPNDRTFKAWVLLYHHALPNFYFHTTTAYDILRHYGIELGKRDFMGQMPGYLVDRRDRRCRAGPDRSIPNGAARGCHPSRSPLSPNPTSRLAFARRCRLLWRDHGLLAPSGWFLDCDYWGGRRAVHICNCRRTCRFRHRAYRSAAGGRCAKPAPAHKQTGRPKPPRVKRTPVRLKRS